MGTCLVLLCNFAPISILVACDRLVLDCRVQRFSYNVTASQQSVSVADFAVCVASFFRVVSFLMIVIGMRHRLVSIFYSLMFIAFTCSWVAHVIEMGLGL